MTRKLRTHLITGATSGIGNAIAQRLILSGDRVIAVVRSEDSIVPVGAAHVVCDFADPMAVNQCFSSFESQIDSFINCAATVTGKAVFDCDAEEIIHTMNVNLVSPLIACSRLRGKITTGGAIVLFSSQSAYRAGYDDVYNVSKGGINTLIKTLSLKYAPDVRVMGIAPGITLGTRMTMQRRSNDLDSLKASIPLRRFGDTDHISKLVEALLGDAGSYITGAVIDVNGGNYLR